ncbi:MAG: transposase [Holophagales bacterium]|jgi:REP element-mobilizing transposase RayT|nr:transposase [Holophagales bacterium]MBK9964005.1 transposase [Holophagales bacterium]
MSRPLRLDHAGALWHVTSRGNERREVFVDDEDRREFVRLLGRSVELFGWKLHAWVLMGNHYHLFVGTPEATLSRGMRQLNGDYAGHFNRRHGRDGHVFQGRFKAILVQREAHLLEVARYVVRNPVRAGLVASPGDWPWSSFRATAGLESAPEWLDTSFVLEQFGSRRSVAATKYREFVLDQGAASYDPWGQVLGQIYLGSASFAEAARGDAKPPEKDREVPRIQREPVTPSVEGVVRLFEQAFELSLDALRDRPRLLSRERALLAAALRRHARATLPAIGEALGVEVSRASILARRDGAEGASKEVRKKIAAFEKLLSERSA